jgi:hypothetical protein
LIYCNHVNQRDPTGLSKWREKRRDNGGHGDEARGLPDGRRLGRSSIHGDIVPVPLVFAHIFTDLAEAQAHLEHTRAAMGFPEAELVSLVESLEP